ncbi:MAG: glycosyltransferase [Nanoarchaeota archaeon]|nr:glycosyltransferase [Nanoarchaeota archaeon]MBU1632459.1 glycosyltransferase [Nanoarchaeota archaeon]MBU1876468.1 glycosyltransferase [Nanoarchaeota archaeon]
MPPKFSIIIPAHNEEEYIKKTLHSIKNQTYQNYETIVVTNGCTDKTEEIVKKRLNDKTKHLSLSKANVCIARNSGAFEAQGEIFLFLDADTTLEDDSLQKINEQFSSEYSVATTKVLPDSDNLKYRLAMKFKNLYNSTNIYNGCSGALICRKEDFNNVKGYNPEIIVKEHRKLIIELKNKTGKKFKCIDTNVTTSMRRFKKWGLTKATIFWIKQWMNNYLGDLKKSDYEKVR